MADLIEKWRGRNDRPEPEDYLPVACPVGLAEDWTNTKSPGSGKAESKWDWALLVDLAFVADSNPHTIQDHIEDLLEGLRLEGVLTKEEYQKVKEEIKEGGEAS